MKIRRDSIFIHQSKLIKKIYSEFNDDLKSFKCKKTPMTPGQYITSTDDKNEDLCNMKLHKRYQSGVGSLLYIVMNSRSDLSNCVRELSKSMKNSSNDNYKSLCRVIIYLYDTKTLGIELIKMNNMDRIDWNLSCYVDSDWAGDPQTRKSISGWVIFVGKSPIVWGSKQQRIVAVSSSEAEFVDISDVCKDLVFFYKGY